MGIRSRLFHGLTAIAALVLVGALVFGFWKGESRRRNRAAIVQDDVPASEMKLTDMEYTEVREGRRLWKLNASEARYDSESQKTLLSNVHLILYTKEGEPIVLESREGLLHAGTKDIDLWGDVKARLARGDRSYELVTESAHYRHGDGVIHSEAFTRVTGPDMTLQGNRWTYFLAAEQAVMEGSVQAVFTGVGFRRP